jgi:hypothetical protein
MSGQGLGYVRPEPLESGLAVRYVRCPKPDTLILTDRKLWKNLGKTWGTEKNMKDIDMIHVGPYYLKNRILDITMSFQFIHLWTSFDDLSWERGYSRNFIQEKDIMDLRDISSLMASQQAIKVNNSHEWIDMVTKTKKLQIFWKPHKITILDRFSKAIILEHSEDFNFQEMSFSIFDLYLISKDILMWHMSSFID